jgi:peptide/nickel transport system substrate-binding protein
MDLTNDMFKDIRVRKAINYAVDTNIITKASRHGAGIPAYGPVPSASWAYDDTKAKYSYNPKKSRELLEQSGWIMKSDGYRYKDGKKFSFKLTFRSGSKSSEAACLYIQSYLKDIGIEVKLMQLDMGALIKSLNPGKYESVVFAWVEPFDPDVFTEWHSSQMGDKGMNFMSYSNKEVDTLLEQARSEFNRNKRKELYVKIQDKITDDAPYIFLYNDVSYFGVNKRVTGLPQSSSAGLWIRPEEIRIVK